MPLLNIVLPEAHVISYYTVRITPYIPVLRYVSHFCFPQVLTELCKEMKTTTELAVKVTLIFLKLFLQFLTESVN
jgi:hypothetical protein